jgi:hypothetical protein
MTVLPFLEESNVPRLGAVVVGRIFHNTELEDAMGFLEEMIRGQS